MKLIKFKQLLIISPRRWGKTSLVKKVINDSSNRDIVYVFTDVFKAKTAAEFCEILGNAVLKQTASAFDELVSNAQKFLGKIHVGLDLSPDRMNPLKLSFGLEDGLRPLEEILELPERIAEKRNVNIVVCIDEFQQITEFEDNLTFQRLLRTIWQHQKNVTYCLFGSKRHMMEGLFDDESKPFFKFGDIMYLTTIPLLYWQSYISEKFRSTSKIITENQIERICETVSYHSSYVQQLCWYVYLFSDDTVTEADIENGINELIAQNSALFESRTEKLTPLQMRFLRAVAEGVSEGFSSAHIISKYKLGSSAAVTLTKKVMLKKGLIYAENHQIKLADPVLGLWMTS